MLFLQSLLYRERLQRKISFGAEKLPALWSVHFMIVYFMENFL